MPLLETNRLTNVREYRRAFLILCMLSHSYVWGKLEKTSEVSLRKREKKESFFDNGITDNLPFLE